MRNLHVLLWICALAAALCSCSPQIAPTYAAPAFSKDSTQSVLTHTMPAVVGDDSPRHTMVVKFKNPFKQSLMIEKIRSSCTCMDAKVRKMCLDANEVSELTVVSDLRGRSGLQRFVVSLNTKDGLELVHQLELMVYPRHRFSLPGHNHVWPEVEPESNLHSELQFEVFAKSSQSLPNQVSLSVSDPQDGQIIMKENAILEIEPGIWTRRSCFSYSQRAPQHSGPFSCSINSQYQLNSELIQAKVSAYGTVRSYFEIRPAFVLFKPGEKEKEVTIRSLDSNEFDLTVDSKCSLANSITIENSKNPRTKTVRISMSVEQPDHRFVTVLLETKHPKQQVISIPVAFVKSTKPL